MENKCHFRFLSFDGFTKENPLTIQLELWVNILACEVARKGPALQSLFPVKAVLIMP
ncbi:hypothetical protein Mucpa_1459 [Mucilaginibacter paludis DSM 18603]|uniref:Uncharacterized protein n=1 Tax=Mucilaginibacter paludis DSM 18603 TaxID=714943 RepID=H1XZC9_9SPHI|nr:hypothetical protein Mucpa_1459 [Mucilaginibacter paludis DSM 18603]